MSPARRDDLGARLPDGRVSSGVVRSQAEERRPPCCECLQGGWTGYPMLTRPPTPDLAVTVRNQHEGRALVVVTMAEVRMMWRTGVEWEARSAAGEQKKWRLMIFRSRCPWTCRRRGTQEITKKSYPGFLEMCNKSKAERGTTTTQPVTNPNGEAFSWLIFTSIFRAACLASRSNRGGTKTVLYRDTMPTWPCFLTARRQPLLLSVRPRKTA